MAQLWRKTCFCLWRALDCVLTEVRTYTAFLSYYGVSEASHCWRSYYHLPSLAVYLLCRHGFDRTLSNHTRLLHHARDILQPGSSHSSTDLNSCLETLRESGKQRIGPRSRTSTARAGIPARYSYVRSAAAAARGGPCFGNLPSAYYHSWAYLPVLLGYSGHVSHHWIPCCHFINFASAFATTYNFAPWQSGLCFISGLIGSPHPGILGGGPFRPNLKKTSPRRNGGIREPEMGGLPAMTIGLIASPLSLILWGWNQ